MLVRGIVSLAFTCGLVNSTTLLGRKHPAHIAAFIYIWALLWAAMKYWHQIWNVLIAFLTWVAQYA